MRLPFGRRLANGASFALLLTSVLVPHVAGAEESGTIAAAEAAYVAVDFDTTKTQCLAALERGRQSAHDTLRLYTLLGVSAAALDDDATARDAFRHVVALDPAGRLDQSLSPKLRAPYLEVRGELSARGELPPLSARLTAREGNLGLVLADRVGVASVVELRLRAARGAEFTTTRVPTAQVDGWRIRASAEQLEYTLVVRDEHDNALFELGSTTRPEILAAVPRDYGLAALPSAPRPSPRPYHVAAGVLAGVGLGLAGAGAYFSVRREQAAREWNSTSCEQPGATRAEQCAAVDERRATAEHWAIGLYAGGGALLASSLVMLLVAPSAGVSPSARAQHALPCTAAIAPLSAACTLAF